MIPVVAIVGHSNVGKSTLFNCLTRSKDALVADYEGLTRDRKYGQGKLGDHDFIVIDTGGISGAEEGLDLHMASQSLKAIDESDVVVFLVDAKVGLTVSDEHLAIYLRKQSKPYFLVINKVDGFDEEQIKSEFSVLGIGNIICISASHRRGIHSMIDQVLNDFETKIDVSYENIQVKSIKIGVIGRPNVGKSTLVNRLLGEERVIVYNQGGTTRDSVYIPYSRQDEDYVLIDTAGVRRRGKVNDIAEKFSIIKTLKAIDHSHVVLLIIDAQEGIVDQDLNILSYALKAGRAIVIVINKWDGLGVDQKQTIEMELDRRLNFINFARIHRISALYGTNVGHLYKSIHEAYQSAILDYPTNFLTRVLNEIVSEHEPPMVGNHRIKLRYCHLIGTKPPKILIHGNQTEHVPKHYRKYLENSFRKVLKLYGTPIKIEFKTTKNPYAKPKG